MVNVLCSEYVPADAVAYLCSAFLTTLKKKSGGLRPVAVGKVLQRLPFPIGSRSSFGCEAIVRSVNTILDDKIIMSN